MGLLSAPAAVDKREYWGFSAFDWANSGYVTTVGTVLFAPYLTSVAETAACGYAGTTDRPCNTNLDVLGLGISPGSLAFYVVTVATLMSALFLPVVGAIADRMPRKKLLMCAVRLDRRAGRVLHGVRGRRSLGAGRAAAVHRQPVPGARRWSSTTRS